MIYVKANLSKFNLILSLLALYNAFYICPLNLALIFPVPESRGVLIELNSLEGQSEGYNPGSDWTELIRKTPALHT